MTRAWWLLGLIAACEHDVRLGTTIDAPADTTPDATANVFTPGSYALSFLDPPTIDCEDALQGMESQFSGVTRAQVSLIDGSVVLATPDVTTMTLTGSPITSGYGVSTVTLTPGVVGPPNFWAAEITTNFGAGPDNTVHDLTLLAFDSTTASAPGGVEGEAGIGFDNSTQTGICTVTFGALLQLQ
jgi:hypothetical protein